jgi:hypothetical protein
MTTNILQLPLIELDCVVGSNEDWRDALAYIDVNGNPISLSGISFACEVKSGNANGAVALSPSTGNGQLAIGGTSSNVLGFLVLNAALGLVSPGDFVFDIVATGDGATVRAATGNLFLVQGVTP